MNTDPVEISFLINNDELEQQSKKAVGSILGIGTSAGDVKKELYETIQFQKKAIAELEAQFKSSKETFDKLNHATSDPAVFAKRQEASKLYKQIRQELDGEKEMLEKLEKQYQKLNIPQNTYMTQIRQIVNDMARLTGEGKKETEQYRELEKQLEKIGTVYKAVNKEKQLLTGGQNSTLAGIMSGMSGIAGAFSAGQGVVSLFVKDNERLAAIQTKLQSAMAITIGLQQVSNTLHATSAFRIKTVTQVTQAWTSVVNRLTIALGGSRIAAQALMGALTLGLSVAIGFAVDWLNKYIDRQKKAAEEQQKFSKAISENSQQTIADFERLRKSYEKVGDTIKDKTDFIIRNQDEFKKLGIEINSVNDADNIFIKNAEAFRESIMLRAQYIASMELAAEKYKASLEKMLNAETRRQNPTFFEKTTNWNIRHLITGEDFAAMYANKAAEKMIKEGEKEKKEGDAFVNRGIKLNEQYFEKINEANIKSLENLKEGSKAWWEGYKKMQQGLLDEFTDKEVGSDAWKKVKAEYDKASQVLKSWDDSTSRTRSEDRDAQRRLDAEQKLDESLRKMALDREKFNIEMRQKEIDLMEDGFAKRGAQIKLNYDKELQSAREFAEKKLKEQQEIERQGYIKGHGNDFGFSPVTTQIIGLPEEIQAQIQSMYAAARKSFDRGNELLARELEDFRNEQKNRLASNLEQQLDSIEQYYRERIRQAAGSEEMIRQLTEDKQKEILNAVTRFQIDLLKSEENITLERMRLSGKRYLFEADREKEVLAISKIYAEKRLSLYKKLQEEGIKDLENEIGELEVYIQGLNKELDNIPVKKIFEALAGIKSIADALGKLDGEVGEVFSSLGNAVDSISESFKRAKSETADYTGAISSGISGVVDIINMVSSASAKRKQAEKEFYQNSIALAHEYALAINETIRTQSKGAGFVTDYAGQIKDSFDSMYDATNQYYEALSKLSEGKAKIDLKNAIDWGNVGKGIGSGAAIGAAIGSVVPVIGTAVGAVVGGIVGGLVGLFGGKKKKEIFGGLLEVFPELVESTGSLNKELAQTLINTNQLDDNTKQLLQNALEWADAVEAANEQIRGIVLDLAGDLGGSIKNALVDAWKAGEDASKRMFEAASESLGKFVQDLLYSAIFSDIFKQFQDDLVASLNPITGDQDVVDDFERLMNALDERDEFYLAALEAVNQRAAERGLDFKNTGVKQKAETGGFKAVSQDSFDLWLGQFTAIRIHTSNIFDAMARENEIMNSLFSKIEENTRVSADCLKDIRVFAKRWNDEGMKIA